MEDDLKQMEDEPINLIGCDTIVNSPSELLILEFYIVIHIQNV